MGCFAVIKENGKEIKFDDQKLLDEYLMERYKNPQIDFLNTKESLESLQTLNEMYDLKNQLDELQKSRNPIKKGKQSKVLQESIVNLQRKYNASVIKYDNLINDLKKNPKFNIKFQLDDNKSERWVHPTERQSENDKTIVVDEGETSSKGFAVLKGTGLETNGSVIYQGDQHPVISESTDKVSIRIGNEIIEVDKSKVLTEVLSDNTQKEEWFDLETEDIDLQNLDKSKLYDEVYNSGRLFNKEYSDEEVYGISAFVIEKALDKKANLKTLIKNAVDLYNNNIEQSPVSKNFSKTPDGHTQSTPNQTYNEAVTNNTRDKGDNLWVRDNKSKTNKDRTLLVQFSSMFLYGKNNFKRDKIGEYYNKLYRTKKGYDRTVDFWEVPLWMARISGLEKNSDVYVIRNMDEAVAFFKEAEYGKVLFSALDINEKHINRITSELPNQSFQIGGYVNFQSLNNKPNVKTFNNVEEYAEYNNLKDTSHYSYRHFRGTAVIPRLKMSEGCTYKCAFCTIPKKVIATDINVVDGQIKEIKDLDATLVYLDDKTFGQAKNYTYLTEVYNQIKEGNPNFEGFIIQTTAVDFADEKRFSKDYLEKSHIKYVELGIETYNDDLLAKLNKRHSSKKYVDAALENARKNNLKIIPNLIVGLGGKNPDGSFWSETAETYENTLNLIRNNKDVISHVNANSLALYEGTELGDSIDVKEEADTNQTIIAKSFHSDPKVHEKAMDDFSDLGIELLDNETKFQLDDIWHGGPHDITSFSTDKIGTGEGEQAFGWGLYFTDMEGIAEFYASVLSKPKLEDKNGNEIVLSKNLANLIKLVYAQHRDLSADLIRQKIKSVASTINRDWSTEAVKEFEQIGDFTLKPFRFKYKVTLHKNKSIDQYAWLDWDQKLNEDQLAKVKDIYDTFSNVETDHKRASVLSRAVDYYNFREKTGQQIYDTIVEEAGRHRGELERRFGDKVVWGRADKIASLLLLDAGIDGVKYPAESIAKGTNRETARGFNYVIFDDTAITIEEKTSFQFDDGPDTLEKAAKHYGVKPEEVLISKETVRIDNSNKDNFRYNYKVIIGNVSVGENVYIKDLERIEGNLTIEHVYKKKINGRYEKSDVTFSNLESVSGDINVLEGDLTFIRIKSLGGKLTIKKGARIDIPVHNRMTWKDENSEGLDKLFDNKVPKPFAARINTKDIPIEAYEEYFGVSREFIHVGDIRVYNKNDNKKYSNYKFIVGDLIIWSKSESIFENLLAITGDLKVYAFNTFKADALESIFGNIDVYSGAKVSLKSINYIRGKQEVDSSAKNITYDKGFVEKLKDTADVVSNEFLQGDTRFQFDDELTTALDQSDNIELEKDIVGNLVAPNGKPSKLNETQWKIVRTPAFKNWFGDWQNDPKNASKVLDANGEPLVVYHGTDAKFNTFYKRMTYFANDPTYAEYFLEAIMLHGKKRIIPAFLNIRRLKDLTNFGLKPIPQEKFTEVTGIKPFEDWRGNSPKKVWQHLRSDDIPIDPFKKIFNGIKIIEDSFRMDDNGEEYPIETEAFLVFLPNQIKLADGTNSTFDPKSNDIRFQFDDSLEEFGVAPQNIEATGAILEQMFNGLKANGLTTASTVEDWLNITKGNNDPEALKLSWGGFEKVGFEESEKFKELVKSGHIVLDYDLANIAGKPVFVLNPDNMLVGRVMAGETEIGAGSGGIHFVSDTGDVWAFSDRKGGRMIARKFNEYLNDQVAKNGEAHVVLSKGSLEKLLSSHAGARGAMGVLEHLTKKGFISVSDFRNALNFVGRKHRIDFNGKADLKSIHQDLIENFVNRPDNTFDSRGTFVINVLKYLSKNSKSVKQNIEQIRKELNTKELPNSTDRLKTGNIKFSTEGISQAIGLLFSDQATVGAKNSDAYAVIKVTGPVKIEKGKHESYGLHIRMVDETKRPTLFLLSDKHNVADVLNDQKNKPTTLSKLASTSVTWAKAVVKSEKEIQDLRVSKNALNKEDQSQYRVSSGENIIESLKDFDNSNDAVTAIVHEVMHPTVVSIIDGAKEENEVGSKHTQTIVNEFNKANPDNAVTVEELIKDNDSFKNGKTTPKYRSVQEFIAKAWDDYHIEGIKTINKSFQKFLDQITEAFRNVYNSLKGSKILTPDLKKLFDELINPEETRFQFDEEKPKLEGQQKTKRDNVLKNLRDNIDRYKSLYGDSKGIYDKFKSMFDERGVTLLDVEHILRGLNPDKSVKQYKREAQQRIDKFEKVLTTAGFSDEEKHAIVNIYAEAAQSWAKKTGRSVVEWWSDIIEDFEYSKDGTDITVNPGESLVYQADEVIKSVWNKILSFFPNTDKTTSTPYTEDKVLENNDSQFLDTNKHIIKGARKMLVNGKAIVYITSSATVATPVHELAHVYEMYMPETDKDQYLKEISKTKWDTDASERFALGFEKFLMDGRKTDNKNLQKIFDNFKTWLTDIYKGLLRWNGENVFLNRAMNRIYSQIFDTSITNIGDYKEVKNRMGKEMLNGQIKVNNATMKEVAELFELELLNPYQRTTAIATVKQAVENGLIDAEGKTIINVANDLIRANRASGGSRAVTPQEAVAIKYYIIKWGRQLANLETLVDQNPENGLMYKDYMELRTALLLLQQADGLGASLAASVLGSRSKVMKDDLFDAAAWVKRLRTADPDITPLKIREFVNLVNEAKETRDRLEAYTKSREAIVKQQEIDYLNKNIREFFKLPAVRNVMNKFKQSNKSFKQIEQDLIEQIRSHYDVKFSMDNDTDDDSALFELVIATLAANPDINTVTDLTNHMIANLPNIEKDEIIDILKAEWSIKGDPELDEEPKIGKKMTRLEEQKNNLKRELQLIEDLKDLFRAKEITGKVNVTKNSVTIRVLRNIIEELKSLSSQDNTTHHNLFMLHHYLDQIEKLHQASLFEITGGPISGVTRDIITKQLLENIDDYISARGTTMEGKMQSLQEKIEDIDRLTDDLNRMKEGKDTQKSYYGILKRINEVGLKEHKIEDAQLFKLRAELSKKTMILQERADEVSEKLGWRILKEAANMPRLLKLAFDYSFTLYQMGMYTYKQLASPNFFRVLRLMKDTIRASVSESYFERTTAAFEKEWGDHVYYQQQLGTIIPERNNQANPEEMLRTKTLLESVLNKVMPKYNFARGIRNFNERGYVTYIRQMRMMETMSMSQGIVDIETKRKIAERVNTFSGASQQFSNNPKWNKVINKGVEIGAYPFIAPRLYLSVYKSMINLLATPITAAKIPFTEDKYVKEYRKRVVKDNIHLMAANVIIPMILGTIANALDPDDDDEIILNPIDSQFLKINIGGTSISLHPLATYVRTAMRLGTKVYLDQIENVAYNTKGRKEYQTYLGAVWDEFLNYRLNPVVSTMALVFQRKDFMNRAVKTDDLGDWFTNIFMAGFAPISLENLSKNINEESYNKIIPEFLLDMMGYNHFHQTSTATPQYKEYTDKVGFKFRIDYPDDWKDSRKKDLFKLRVQQEFGDEVNGMLNNGLKPNEQSLKKLRKRIENKVKKEME